MSAVEPIEARDLHALMQGLGERARAAALELASIAPERKTAALHAAASAVRRERTAILEANARDLAEAKRAGMRAAFLDRLALDQARLEAIAARPPAVAA